MKITKREDISLIFLGELAKKYSPLFIPLSVIARETKLSEFFLRQIASKLVTAKLIESKEGVSGGYRLSRDPKQISVASVLTTISQGIVTPSCAYKLCELKRSGCVCNSLWNKINRELYNTFNKITLSELAGL